MDSMKKDRLYELLPAIYRQRDAEQGRPLRALLRIITEQVNIVEDDIRRLHENWFIETCANWVVPYIGDLIGYTPVHAAGHPRQTDTAAEQLRNAFLIPRREVANTIRYRKRKGTLALLELLAGDVSGWPARAVEFYRLLAWTQHLNHLHPQRARTVDLRDGAGLDLLNGPFDLQAHGIDVRRISSTCSRRYFNIPSVGLFVWRLKTYPVTQTPASCGEGIRSHCFTFSVLGNDAPLYMRAEPEADPTLIADEENLPVPIRRRFFAEQTGKIYGPLGGIRIWKGVKKGRGRIRLRAVPIEQIVPADLSGWQYQPRRNTVAVDPVLGRIMFPSRLSPKNGLWVSYRYGFSADMGGGEYGRRLFQPESPPARIYQVCKKIAFENPDEDRHGCADRGKEVYPTILAALQQWMADRPEHAVIEILDSSVYTEPVRIDFDAGGETDGVDRSLQLRAANRKRPVIRLVDWEADQPDSMVVIGSGRDRFTLDGIMVAGHGIQLYGGLAEFVVRHSTLVPGYVLSDACVPRHPADPSLEIFSPEVCVRIEHSITGSIQIDPAVMLAEIEGNGGHPTSGTHSVPGDEASMAAQCQGIGREVRLDPIRLCISDSIVDATDPSEEAIGSPGCPVAHAVVTSQRVTIRGQVQVHAITLAEDSLFVGRVMVARRQQGCMRFCSVLPGSRTPRRYRCQPDLVIAAVEKAHGDGLISGAERNELLTREQARVRPIFNSVRYGTPTYMQLAESCAEEIKRGAEDESEMGAFHDVFQPQRLANLEARIQEYLPAGMDAAVILSS